MFRFSIRELMLAMLVAGLAVGCNPTPAVTVVTPTAGAPVKPTPPSAPIPKQTSSNKDQKRKWLPITETAKAGPVRVSMESVRIGKVVLQKHPEAERIETDKDYLVLRLKLAKSDSSPELRYFVTGWPATADDDNCICKDEHGNEYTMVCFRDVVDDARGVELNPGDEVHMVVVIEAPAKDADFMRLEMETWAAYQMGGPIDRFCPKHTRRPVPTIDWEIRRSDWENAKK